MLNKISATEVKISKETRKERIADAKAILEKWGVHQVIILTVNIQTYEIAASAYGANQPLATQASKLGAVLLDAVADNYIQTSPFNPNN